MIIWVLYDIEDDKSRSKVAWCCKQAGLHRVQLSCFLGSLDAHELDVLELLIIPEINPETDKVYMFPMSKAELKATILLGQAFDKKLVSDEILAMYF
jgi:CRISPR-associated protein Cas2